MEQNSTFYTYETIEKTSSIAAMVQRIASSSSQELALVSITMYFENGEKDSLYPVTQVQPSTAYLMNSLRPLVRKTDAAFLLEDSHYISAAGEMHARYSLAPEATPILYFLLFGANAQGGQIVQSRLWEALLWRVHNTSEREMLRPQSITIGHSAYPTPYPDIDEFIEAASDVSMYLDRLPEKSPRKAVIRQSHQLSISQEAPIDEELPALARKLGIPYLSLLPRKLPRYIQQLMNPKLAQELNCFPIGRERNMLTVAMLNPQDHDILDRLRHETGFHIYPVLTHPQALQTALAQFV